MVSQVKGLRDLVCQDSQESVPLVAEVCQGLGQKGYCSSEAVVVAVAAAVVVAAPQNRRGKS